MTPSRPTLGALIATEARKVLARPWLWAALAAPPVVVIVATLGGRLLDVQRALASGSAPEDIVVDTAFRPAAAALRLAAVVAALITGIAGAIALAEERRLGTLRTILAGPVTRARFYIAKVAGIALLASILVGAGALTALATGALASDFVAGAEWEYAGHTVASMWSKLAFAVVLSWLAVVAVGCLGLFASSTSASGSTALVTLLLLVALLEGATQLGPPAQRERLSAFNPLTYVTHPARHVAQQISGIGASSWCVILLPRGREAWEPRLPVAVTGLAALVLATAGLLVFRRRAIF